MFVVAPGVVGGAVFGFALGREARGVAVACAIGVALFIALGIWTFADAGDADDYPCDTCFEWRGRYVSAVILFLGLTNRAAWVVSSVGAGLVRRRLEGRRSRRRPASRS